MPMIARCQVCRAEAEWPNRTNGWRVDMPMPFPIGQVVCPTCREAAATALRTKVDLTKATAAQVEAVAEALGIR